MATRKQIDESLKKVNEVKDDLINNIIPKIKQDKNDIEAYKSELLIDGENKISIRKKISNIEEEIKQSKLDIVFSVSEILKFYNKVFEGSDVDKSIKNSLENYLKESENLFTETQEMKDDFDIFYEKVFGKEDESGEVVGGLEKELNKYEIKYKTLFDKIESLLPGATTAGLAKVFSDKVNEYRKMSKIWTVISFGLLLLLVVNYFSNPLDSNDINQIFIGLLNRLPFIVFAIWLVVFSGNRRAENKKLEELYKHKEVMARSFVGYKEQIEGLDESDVDKTLLKKLTENLLDAISDNSADFLDKKGDNSPVHDVVDVVKDFVKNDKK